MVKCVVRGCQNQSDLKPGEMLNRPRKRFFSFPADQGRVRVWLAALRETERSSTEQKICEDHFLPEHITSNGISPDAIPIMPPLEGAILGSGCWTSSVEPSEELSDPNEVVRLFHSSGVTPRSEEVKLGRLTRNFIDLLYSAPEGILDLNEATEKLGTRKRRVYDITNVLNGIKLITKKSKSKIQWVGPSPISCFKGQWRNKLKTDLLNLKTMEESLDWLIKDCAQQLFTLTDLTENAKYPYMPAGKQEALKLLVHKTVFTLAYVTHEDICRLAAFRDQTVIAIKAPEETKLEVPTPTEECIKIFLKGSRGPVHVLTCETNDSETNTQLKNGHFLTLEESRIKTTPLLTGYTPTVIFLFID
ncbi:Transcription factor E2F6 [Bagarius yarrelli]|uniref:Transcription factor E2F6 n=1 Tax=Bagarius yarrelli TaxID=175774 RepID=A0A556VAK0_BAGYA|nr:Transcription factor E2F6 [Bagarius yarrelli]